MAESLRVAHATGALKARDLARVSVDTTVQPKNITFPTDVKLMHKAIVMPGRLAKAHGVPLRRSYVRVAKRTAISCFVDRRPISGIWRRLRGLHGHCIAYKSIV